MPSTLTTLRQPRYAALSALMLVVATACVVAGTWQISRYDWKHGANTDLRHNAHAKVLPVGDVLPLTGSGRSVAGKTVEFRHVTASGTYDAAHQSLVRHRSEGGEIGYVVVTPLHTSDGVLLVARGFIKQADVGNSPPSPPAPTGTVRVEGFVHPAETANDRAASLPTGQVESVNPAEQARRLGSPVYDGYIELLGGQPGTSGLGALDAPDLSNPAGGAVEPQHLAYIVQWYLFAILALAAPIVMARAESRHKDDRDFDLQDRFNDADADSEPQRSA